MIIVCFFITKKLYIFSLTLGHCRKSAGMAEDLGSKLSSSFISFCNSWKCSLNVLHLLLILIYSLQSDIIILNSCFCVNAYTLFDLFAIKYSRKIHVPLTGYISLWKAHIYKSFEISLFSLFDFTQKNQNHIAFSGAHVR